MVVIAAKVSTITERERERERREDISRVRREICLIFKIVRKCDRVKDLTAFLSLKHYRSRNDRCGDV